MRHFFLSELFFLILLIESIYAGEDFYEILGVSRDASQKEIKKAFRTLSLKYHPDRNPGDQKAHDMFLKINKAHETLTDPDKRIIKQITVEDTAATNVLFEQLMGTGIVARKEYIKAHSQEAVGNAE